jgi:hypothetical protein
MAEALRVWRRRKTPVSLMAGAEKVLLPSNADPLDLA